MQFIFGNNKSKYDLLYTDDKREDASSVLNILKIPFAPTEEYDVYGYVPFGTNSNRPLFFHCQKDTELSRSVYFLHGIYRELSSEYFFSDEYMSDLCAGFIGQESFNSLREQSEGFSYTVNTDAALLQTARNGVEISETKLKTIVYHLYKRTATISDNHLDLGRTCIYRVLNELLDHIDRALHNLSGRYFIDRLFTE